VALAPRDNRPEREAPEMQYQLKVNLHFAEKSIDAGLRAPVNLRPRK